MRVASAMTNFMLIFLIILSHAHTGTSLEVTPIDDYESHYQSGSWNYNYSQTVCGTCSTTSKCGPYCWSKVSPSSTNKCGGYSQTPINIVQVQTNADLQYPEFVVHDDGCSSWVQFADDHAFEVSFSDAHCENLQLIYNKVTYNLTQFHFHAPAEHAIGGGIADAELHMVHKSSSGRYLVLGIRMSATIAYNNFLHQFWNAAEIGAIDQNYEADTKYSKEYEVTNATAVNPYSDFLPASKNFYTYSGSLTTYPCTEGITWIVFEEVVHIGNIDLENLKLAVSNQPNTITFPSPKSYFHHADNRPVQPLNNRIVEKYTDSYNMNTSIYHTTYSTASAASQSTTTTNITHESPYAIISIVNLILNALIICFLAFQFLLRKSNGVSPHPKSFGTVA